MEEQNISTELETVSSDLSEMASLSINETDDSDVSDPSIEFETSTPSEKPMEHREPYSDFRKNFHFVVEESLLRDEIRMQAYKKAIFENKNVFREKIVLVLKCGIGVLAVFAAQAGASKVIAIENTELFDLTKELVEENNLSHIIKVMQGDIKKVELPENQFDVIIHNSVGPCMFKDVSLESIIFARDNYLKRDGYLFPDRYNLFICGLEDTVCKFKKMRFWDNINGFDFSAFQEMALNTPTIDLIDANYVVTGKCQVMEVDLYTVKQDYLANEFPFTLVATKTDYLQSLVIYFSVEFTKCLNKFSFSTAPDAKPTHYKQTIFFLDKNINVVKDDILTGTLKFENFPDMEMLKVAVKIFTAENEKVPHEEREYILK